MLPAQAPYFSMRHSGRIENKIRISMETRKYLIIFAFLALTLFPGVNVAAVEEGVKDVEVTDASIKFAQNEPFHSAYLYMELKNNGDKDIDNLNFQINYYDAEECLIKKVVMKNKLTDILPAKGTKKYKVRLRGDVFNERNEEYPYSQKGDVDDFDVKILDVKFSKK